MNKCVHGFPGQKGFQILLQVICTFLLDLFVSRVSREEPALPPGHLAAPPWESPRPPALRDGPFHRWQVSLKVSEGSNVSECDKNSFSFLMI